MNEDLQKKIAEAMRNPQNVGELLDADAIGTVGNSDCGEMLRLWVKFKQQNGRKVIDKATFQSFGCETAIAVASLSDKPLTPRVRLDPVPAQLGQRGQVFRVDEDSGRLDLDQILKKLAEQGITRCLVEGGPTVASSLVAANLVDEAILVRGEKTIGESGIDPLVWKQECRTSDPNTPS